jgi:hypothetical protein
VELKGDLTMNDPKAIASALRTAADNLERAKRLADGLPQVDQASAFALAYDLPRVVLAFSCIAGTLDPEPEEEEIDIEELARLRCQ